MFRSRIAWFAGLLGVGASAILTLRWLGSLAWLQIDWSHPLRWAASGPLDDVVAGLVRVLALTCAYWLIGSALLYGLARLVRIPSLVRSAEWVTLPVVRTLVDRALAIALASSAVVAGSTVAASAVGTHRAPVILTLAATSSPTLAPPLPTNPAPSPTPPPTPSPTPRPGYVPTPAGPGPRPTSPSTQPSSPGPPEAWTTHRVVPGDNLWTIAAQHLVHELDVRASHLSNRRIAIYWLKVVSANRDSLRSGDPDLIYPGEVVKLPPIVQASGSGH
jgi:LysM domain